VRASHIFYVGITNIPIDAATPTKLMPSKQLSFVTDPEEKRKIIGDVFMRVSSEPSTLMPDAVCFLIFRYNLLIS
jgi:GMP synthase PP-ATPase subunit